MKYLFNLSAAYVVEADTEEAATQLIHYNLKDYQPTWQEITFIEEEENK